MKMHLPGRSTLLETDRKPAVAIRKPCIALLSGSISLTRPLHEVSLHKLSFCYAADITKHKVQVQANIT